MTEHKHEFDMRDFCRICGVARKWAMAFEECARVAREVDEFVSSINRTSDEDVARSLGIRL